MGMYDNVVILDEPLACPAGHSLSGLQTKSFRDPSMGTYLIAGGRVLLAARSAWHDDSDEDERSAWRITGDEAVRESHYRLEPVLPPADLRVYTHCAHCEPVLARTDRANLWGDIVQEHRLFVEFSLQFVPSVDGEPMRARCVSGGRDELMGELRRSGLRVLEDDEPLAVAHREILRAKDASRNQKAGRRAY